MRIATDWHRLRYFRVHPNAAPLKGITLDDGSEYVLRHFRVHPNAAPLKVFDFPMAVNCLAEFPRSSERGPIEGNR